MSHSLFLVVLNTNRRNHHRLATYTGSPATLDIRNFNLRKSQVKREGKVCLLQFSSLSLSLSLSLYTTQIIVLKTCLFLFAPLEFSSPQKILLGRKILEGHLAPCTPKLRLWSNQHGYSDHQSHDWGSYAFRPTSGPTGIPQHIAMLCPCDPITINSVTEQIPYTQFLIVIKSRINSTYCVVD